MDHYELAGEILRKPSRRMARIVAGLRRLSREGDRDAAACLACLRARLRVAVAADDIGALIELPPMLSALLPPQVTAGIAVVNAVAAGAQQAKALVASVKAGAKRGDPKAINALATLRTAAKIADAAADAAERKRQSAPPAPGARRPPIEVRAQRPQVARPLPFGLDHYRRGQLT